MPIVSGGVGTGFQVATVSLTNAQVLTLPTTPVQLVAAPAAGHMILSPATGHGFAVIHCDTTTAAYTNVDSHAVFSLTLGGNSATANYTFASQLLTFNADAILPLNPAGVVGSGASTVAPIIGSPVDTVADTEGQALLIDATNGASGNFTGGNAANTFVIQIGYLVVAVT